MSKFRFLIPFLILSLFASPLFADYKLQDAIQEFGEKRFVKTSPTRLKAGPLRFHPTLRNQVTYDDNILRERHSGKNDTVFNIKPGAIVELPIDKHQLAIGYEADFEIFSHEKRQNSQNQNFFALADLNFPSWYVNVLEQLNETSDRAGTTFTDRIPRTDQSINPKIGYHWNRLTFETGFQHFYRDFRRHAEKPFDFQIVQLNNAIFYDLYARLKAVWDYSWAQIDYPSAFGRNGTFQQTRVGIEGEVSPNVFIKSRVGPHFRNYRRSSEPDFYSWVANFQLKYRMRENLNFKLLFSREPVEATFGDVNYYKEHAMGGGVEYAFRPKWIVFTDVLYKNHRYAERATVGSVTAFRRDNYIDVKTGLRYLMHSSVEFELAYQYLHRTSNFSSLGYTENLVSVSSQLSY